MFSQLNYFKLFILVTLLLLGLSRPQHSLSSPLYGGNKPSVAQEFNPKQVTLAVGTVQCVRTAWIGDINSRTVVCVEWRQIKRENK